MDDRDIPPPQERPFQMTREEFDHLPSILHKMVARALTKTGEVIIIENT